MEKARSFSRQACQHKPLTIFTVPEAFEGQNRVVQRNAIRSWLELVSRPEIILFGSNPGVAETAAEFGLRYVPDIACNSYGKPLVDDVFGKAQLYGSNEILAYVSPDIVLLDDFCDAVDTAYDRFEAFLLAGRRWEADITEEIDTGDPVWKKHLRQFVYTDGYSVSTEIDYLVFTSGLWDEICGFGLDSRGWRRWLVGRAIENRKAVIDASDTVMAIHHLHAPTAHTHTHTHAGQLRCKGYSGHGFTGSNIRCNVEADAYWSDAEICRRAFSGF
jgi:hypothetical protein